MSRKRARPTSDFIAIDLDETDEHGDDESNEEEEEQDDNGIDLPLQKGSPLQVDWQCSDLSLEARSPGRGGSHGTILAQSNLLPGCWGLARGLRTSFQGRHVWHVRILKLPELPTPSLLFGILVHWPGCSQMPGAGSQQPAMILLANTGEQIFSSNVSDQLLHSPLLPALAVGDVIHVIADLGRRRLHFRRGGDSAEAKALPVRRDASGRGSHSSHRLRETGYSPFLALLPGVEVELLDSLSPLPERAAAAEAVVLAGPPKAGKSTWAADYVKDKGHQLLGAEWLEHRRHFLDEPELSLEAHGGRLALAQRLIRAFSAPTPAAAPAAPAALAPVLPELLRRAAQRAVSVVADDAHLQSARRTEIRAALLRFPGRVRWVVVLPKTLEELLRRQAATQATQATQATGTSSASSASSASLPGAEVGPVEFVEGQGAIFHQWLARQANRQATPQMQELPLRHGMQHFFGSFGDPSDHLSTEGMRRY